MPWRKELAHCLPAGVVHALSQLDPADAACAREIRFRIGCNAAIRVGDALRRLPIETRRTDMDELVAALCQGAFYAHERSMAQGYITLAGGHRAGFCGRLVHDDGGASRMSGVTSVCIRIARHIPGASAGIRGHLLDEQGLPRSVLILGPPGSGKTTVLRDAALYLSREKGLQTAAADEREELFAGRAMRGFTANIDVLYGRGKAEMIGLLLRSMTPEVIVCDEIGSPGDAEAILDAARCGVGVLASAHACGIDAAAKRPALIRLMDAGVFARYICLSGPGEGISIYDGALRRLI